MARINRFDIPALERGREELATLARAVARGEHPLLAGVRRLLSLGYALDLDATHEDFRVLLACDSESDSLPVGEERQNWNSVALQEQDRMIASTERRWEKAVRAASGRLADRLIGAV